MVAGQGLIGFRSMFLTMTSGSGIMTHVFDHYGPVKNADIAGRANGCWCPWSRARPGYSIFNLQDRGRMFIPPNIDVYEGQIIGLHSRNNDLAVNPTKGKQLTTCAPPAPTRRLLTAGAPHPGAGAGVHRGR